MAVRVTNTTTLPHTIHWLNADQIGSWQIDGARQEREHGTATNYRYPHFPVRPPCVPMP
jgi:hypothetical protein